MALTGETHYEINSEKCGKINVYTMGSDAAEVVIITVHDLGCNHRTFNALATHGSFTNITKKSRWVHVDVPGQEDEAPDLAKDYKFPTMDQLAEGIYDVVQQLGIKQCVLLGEGSGANVLARFAMNHEDMVLGACLVHCTGTTAGFMEKVKDKIIAFQLEHGNMDRMSEKYFQENKFGQISPDNEEVQEALELFKQDLRTKINPRNLKLYVESFLTRTPLVSEAHRMNIYILLATGKNAAHNHTVHTYFGSLNQANLKKPNKKTVELLEIDDVANVFLEAPVDFARGFLCFLQGLGKLGYVSVPSGRKESLGSLRGRTMSMEQADLPRGPESLTKVPGRKTSVQDGQVTE